MPEEEDDIVHVEEGYEPVVFEGVGLFGDCLKAKSSKGY